MEAGQLVNSELVELREQVDYLLHKWLFRSLDGQREFGRFLTSFMVNRYGAVITVPYAVVDRGHAVEARLPDGTVFREEPVKHQAIGQDARSLAIIHLAYRLRQAEANGTIQVHKGSWSGSNSKPHLAQSMDGPDPDGRSIDGSPMRKCPDCGEYDCSLDFGT